jgi:hypothetical protein
VDGEKTCQETVLIIYLPGLRVPPWMKGKWGRLSYRIIWGGFWWVLLVRWETTGTGWWPAFYLHSGTCNKDHTFQGYLGADSWLSWVSPLSNRAGFHVVITRYKTREATGSAALKPVNTPGQGHPSLPIS